MSRFQSAAVIGTGMMGPGIAGTLAYGGVQTTILSRTAKSAAEGLTKAIAQLELLESHGLLDPARAQKAKNLLAISDDFDSLIPNVDLVVESAPENMAFKQDLFARLDAISKSTTVLATNTSGLSITAIASKCQHPERTMTTHFWNPPHLMPLVEIVRGASTDPAIAEEVRQLLILCGKVPVIVNRDTPGQLGNRLQMALVREAIHIVQEGIASVEDVDLAARTGFGLRLPMYGIFEHQDMVGLDMSKSIVDYVATDLNSEKRAPQMLHDLVAQGNLGVKTGKGFYDWSVKSADAVKARRDQFILQVLQWGKAT